MIDFDNFINQAFNIGGKYIDGRYQTTENDAKLAYAQALAAQAGNTVSSEPTNSTTSFPAAGMSLSGWLLPVALIAGAGVLAWSLNK